jgi:cell division protease FtsH
MAVINLDQLPLELTNPQAITAAYGPDLDWLADKLRARLSVLVECDKVITQHLYMALRDRLKRDPARPQQCVLMTGHPRKRRAGAAPPAGGNDLPPAQRAGAAPAAEAAGPEPPAPTPSPGPAQGYLTQFLDNLRNVLQELIGRDDVVVVLPHLDLLTTTTKSGLTDQAKETLAWIYENPEVTLLAFKDPGFEIPKPVEDVFTVKHSIMGLRREAIGSLLLRREARKFTADELNPYRFYKYVSGLNALKFRRLMAAFDSAPDFDPGRPETAEGLYRQLRAMTLLADFEVPNVDLWTDLGGYETIKHHLEQDILSLLKRRDDSTDEALVQAIERVVPKGLIFYGPPGTGKTYFAKALATALDATLIVVNGPELKERWVGASEENLRRVFTRARQSAPSIIVFDELDSIAARRGMYYGSGAEHSLVNQLLTEMDGFRANELVFVVGTTNFPEALDPALLRPGRFELQIEIPYPTTEDRRAILEIYRRQFALDLPDEVLDYAVERTADYADYGTQARYSGDHLYAACRALKRKEIRSGAYTVKPGDIDEVLHRPTHGTLVVSEHELQTVAYHEAGHAICAHVLPHTPGVRKVSIVPGELNLPTLGIMLQKARDNQHLVTRDEFLDHIAVTLGGRLAEELALKSVSNGAQNDLAQASQVARAMVEELGMGETIGIQAMRVQTNEGSRRREIGEALAGQIDEDVQAILDESEQRAREAIGERLALLEHLAGRLLSCRSLEGEALAAAWELAPPPA